MKILDSNLWVKGTLKTNQTAVELLDAIEQGSITSAIDEYILAEILAAFDRALVGRNHDKVLTSFLGRLHMMEGLVEYPEWHTQRTAEQKTILEYHRSRTTITMLANVFEIQIKDAPVLTFAYEYRDQEPVVLTNDESFSAFVPSRYNLSTLSIQYIE